MGVHTSVFLEQFSIAHRLDISKKVLLVKVLLVKKCYVKKYYLGWPF